MRARSIDVRLFANDRAHGVVRRKAGEVRVGVVVLLLIGLRLRAVRVATTGLDERPIEPHVDPLATFGDGRFGEVEVGAIRDLTPGIDHRARAN